MPQSHPVTGKKTNKTFMILSALGILFVVDSHVGPDFSQFLVFPYSSFYMPMFAFISGYFFSEKHAGTWEALFRFTDKKIRTLLIPYALWILFYGILTKLGRVLGVWEIGKISLIDLIHNIITGGTSYFFNDPSWFVPLLFCVIVSYAIIRKLLQNHWNHYIAMVVFAGMGAAAIALSQTDFRTHNTYMLMKIPCFLQYYHLGVLFREKLEDPFDKLHPVAVLAAAAAVHYGIVAVYGSNTGVTLYSSMSGYELNAPFLPFVSAVAGIAFWLKIAKCLTPVLGGNRLVNFISENTFFFMTHHLLAKHLFLGMVIAAHNAGILYLPDISQQDFRSFAWYTYSDSPVFALICLVVTLAILTVSASLFHRLSQKISPRLSWATKKP